MKRVLVRRMSVAIDNLPKGVRVVRLNRPEKLNALNMEMFRGIRDAALEVASAPDVRAVVLTGNGRAFCAGLDIRGASPSELLERDESIGCNLAQSVSFLWRRVQAPVICAIRGPCFGGGFQIALGADIRIASTDAKFSVMEAKWGLIPDMGITVSALPATVPRDKAKELAFTGRVFDSQEASSLGLVTRVVDDPEAAALEMAEKLASNQSPDALRAAKRLLDATYDDQRLLHLETQIQRKLLYSWNQLAKSASSLQFPSPGFLNPSQDTWSQEADDRAEEKIRQMLGDDESPSSST